jgi:hypothetical protein
MHVLQGEEDWVCSNSVKNGGLVMKTKEAKRMNEPCGETLKEKRPSTTKSPQAVRKHQPPPPPMTTRFAPKKHMQHLLPPQTSIALSVPVASTLGTLQLPYDSTKPLPSSATTQANKAKPEKTSCHRSNSQASATNQVVTGGATPKDPPAVQKTEPLVAQPAQPNEV